MDEFEAFEVLSREVAAGQAVAGELDGLVERLMAHLAAATQAFEVLHSPEGSDHWLSAWKDYGLSDLYDALDRIGERVRVTLEG